MIVKIWPIRADYNGARGKVGGTAGISNAVQYITDVEKVSAAQEDIGSFTVFDMDDISVESFINTERDFHRVVKYMANEDKTEGRYISYFRCSGDSDLVQEFELSNLELAVKSNGAADINTGNLAFHMVQSFTADLDISDDEVHECGCELLKSLGIYQGIVCTHVHPVMDDKNEVHGKCKHNHILFNAYRAADTYKEGDPPQFKYHDCKETYEQLQIYNDRIAIEHGLPIIRNPDMERMYSWTENSKANEGTSWKERIRFDIEGARRAARDWDDFVGTMRRDGYEITGGKHVTYCAPDGHKARGATLGREYNRESLNLYWAIRDHQMETVKEELKENKEPILSDFILSYPGELSVKLPLGPQHKAGRAFHLLPLKDAKGNSTALETYMDMGKLYDICDEHGTAIAARTGLEILRSIEDLRDEELMKRRTRMRMEQDEIEAERTKREAEKAEEEAQKERYYNPKFKNSRTKNYYYIGAYDEDGHRRSALELIFILALLVMDKEYMLWNFHEIQGDADIEVVYAKKDWKLQSMFDGMTIAREEGLETPAQLERRLNVVGADLSRAKKAYSSTTKAKERMDPLAETVAQYKKTKQLAESIQAMPEGIEKTALQKQYVDVIQQYKKAKHVLYANKIRSDVGVEDFDHRYWKIQRDKDDLEKRVKTNSEQYRRLKKLSYARQLAENERFVYGPGYTPLVQEQAKEKSGVKMKTSVKEYQKSCSGGNEASELRNAEITTKPHRREKDEIQKG